MIPEKAKAGIEELTREQLIELVYELLDRLSEVEEKLRLKQTPTTSKNSSQPSARDFKVEKKKRKRSRKKGAKAGHEKHERALVDEPSKVIEVYVDNCSNCHLNLLDQVPVRTVRRQITELPEIEPVVIETRQHEVICPWGDFSATVVDPADDTSFWTLQEYAEAPTTLDVSRWGTWWGMYDPSGLAPPPPPPLPPPTSSGGGCLSVSPSHPGAADAGTVLSALLLLLPAALCRWKRGKRGIS